jgi:glycosyltransferase involved in cell wall biosynthesis
MGYCAGKFAVIPNGYDLDYLKRDAGAGVALRTEWHVPPGSMLLGMVARWDPYKDHANLLQALALLRDRGADFRCALVGNGADRDTAVLTDIVDSLALADRMVFAGPRDDIPAVMSALDLHVLSSAGESFPNAVAEAMACETPCVVTDVGDSALIVGDTGWVVPPRDSRALAQGIGNALTAVVGPERAEQGRRCRNRIASSYDLTAMVAAYHALWKGAAAQGAAA